MALDLPSRSPLCEPNLSRQHPFGKLSQKLAALTVFVKQQNIAVEVVDSSFTRL
jgi:hypothetical protein